MTDTISDSSIDPSEREFGPSGISLSPYRFPTGWFIVGFASDLAAGEVISFTETVNRRSRAVMERLGLRHTDDIEVEGVPFVLYRTIRSRSTEA